MNYNIWLAVPDYFARPSPFQLVSSLLVVCCNLNSSGKLKWELVSYFSKGVRKKFLKGCFIFKFCKQFCWKSLVLSYLGERSWYLADSLSFTTLDVLSAQPVKICPSVSKFYQSFSGTCNFDRWIFCNSLFLQAILILTLVSSKWGFDCNSFPLHSEGLHFSGHKLSKEAVDRCCWVFRPGHGRRGAAAWNTSLMLCLAATRRWMSEIAEEEHEDKKMGRRESPLTTKACSSSA